jgi:hypothetical protein
MSFIDKLYSIFEEVIEVIFIICLLPFLFIFVPGLFTGKYKIYSKDEEEDRHKKLTEELEKIDFNSPAVREAKNKFLLDRDEPKKQEKEDNSILWIIGGIAALALGAVAYSYTRGSGKSNTNSDNNPFPFTPPIPQGGRLFEGPSQTQVKPKKINMGPGRMKEFKKEKIGRDDLNESFGLYRWICRKTNDLLYSGKTERSFKERAREEINGGLTSFTPNLDEHYLQYKETPHLDSDELSQLEQREIRRRQPRFNRTRGGNGRKRKI